MNCPICSGPGKPYREVDGYRSLICRDCRHIFVVTEGMTFGQAQSLYDYDFYRNYMSGMGYHEAFRRGLEADFRKKVELMSEYVPKGGSILEVGSGPGYFAAMLQEAGYDVVAVELNKAALKYAEDHNVPFRNFRCEDISGDGHSLASSRFDAVLSWAVIEHVPDPVSYLRLLKKHLKPGGLLLFDTGLTTRLIRFLDRGYTSWLSPPHHLHVFSDRSIRLVLERAGLRQVKFIRHFQDYRKGALIPWKILSFYAKKTVKAALEPGRWLRKKKPGEIGVIALMVSAVEESAIENQPQ